MGKTPLKAVSPINLTEDTVAWVVAAEVQKIKMVYTIFICQTVYSQNGFGRQDTVQGL